MKSDPRDHRSFTQNGARASIRDVAALAGVSVGTVSNTINRPESVRRLTREAVERAIEELHFVPNQQARVLGGISSQIIGLIVLDIVSPFFMEIARSVERVANDYSNVVILSNSDNDQHKEERLLDMLAAQNVKGVLLTPASISSKIQPRTKNIITHVPIVYLDYRMPEGHCSISVDNIAGAQMAIRHLLELGRDKIAFVGDPGILHQFADRVEGTKKALRQAGLDPEEVLTIVKVPGIGMQDGIMAAKQLLKGDLPTGILCGNDMMAFGVYRALISAGVKVPEDIALIGYDDIEFAADWILPLTSVRQPTAELGMRGAQLLLEHATGASDHEHQQIVLRPELVIRSSTDPQE